MTRKDEIISCYGYLTQISTAKVFGITAARVCKIWTDHDLSSKGPSQRNINPWKK